MAKNHCTGFTDEEKLKHKKNLISINHEKESNEKNITINDNNPAL
jgi:hypothetical protein